DGINRDQAVVDARVRRPHVNHRCLDVQRPGHDGPGLVEIREPAAGEDAREMIGQLGLAGVRGGQMQQADIDPARLSWIEPGIEYLPGLPEGGLREQILPEYRVPEGLWLLHKGMDQMPVIDDTNTGTAAFEVAA